MLKRSLSRSHRPGLTIVELMLAGTIMGVMAMMVSGMVISNVQGRETNQDDLMYQQDMASLLTQFSQDVRAGSGLVVSEATRFRVRHAKKDGSFRYVSYRLLNGQLQRGEGSSATNEPSYVALLDPVRLKVSSGTFGYFETGNKSAASTATMRRVEIRNFQVTGAKNNAHVAAPLISAVMREGTNARSMVLSGCGGAGLHGHVNGANAWKTGAVHMDVPMHNISSKPATVNAFSASWASGTAPNPLTQLGIGSASWSGSYANGSGVQPLSKAVTIAAGDTENVDLKFHKVSGKIDTLALMFYSTTDTARVDPYVLFIDID